ncbi:integrase family protein [Pelagibius sp.]|uniref:tyrosine-type recombinase/integrase n=1 Tax=Pelagibius sp. TaxID=1931238 RepID=UPI002612B081|nr:integrase family protein [Pelagibius sp.]
MPQLKLTKTNIDRVAKRGIASRDLLYWDTEPKGFGLRVTPTGKATFIVQGRVSGSTKEARITIGPYGVFTADQARAQAREHLRDMRMGLDPRDLRAQEEALRVTLQEVCESYLERPGKLRDTTAAEYRRHVTSVFAAWAERPVVSITEDDVRQRHRELVTRGLTGSRGAPASANAAMVTLRILLNYASRQYRRADGSPLILHNPVNVLKDHWAPLGTRTDRYVDRKLVGKVFNALMDARRHPKNADALASIDLSIFLLLTGARRNEAAQLTWDRVNIDDSDPTNCWWHIPERKRGDPIWLPLNSQAVGLLRARQSEKAGKPNSYVFPSRSKAGHIKCARATMELVSRVVGKHLSLHDLRRTFTNIAMRECLIEKFRTDLLTGHKPAQADITARNYLDLARLDWLHPEVQKIGDWVERQAQIDTNANVMPLTTSRGAASGRLQPY